MHTILIRINSVWEDDVCFVNPVLFDRFRGLTHYWGNDRRVFDKRDQALPSDTSALIFSLETQRSLKANNAWDKYLVVEFKPGISPGTADEKPIDSDGSRPLLQLICDSSSHKELVKVPHLSLLRPFTIQIPAPFSKLQFKAAAVHSKGCSLSKSRCVCNFFTLDRNLVTTCCHSQTDWAVIFVRLGFC